MFIKLHQGAVTVFAGSETGIGGTTDGNGTNARFSHPRGIAIDASGNLYIGDEDVETLRKITPQGEVSTVPGISGKFEAMCTDAANNLYIAAVDKIQKLTPGGTLTTIAGGGTSDNADGTAPQAGFKDADGICVDRSSNLIVCDYSNHNIRKVTQQGVVTTLAGSNVRGTANGIGRNAQFDGPWGIAMDKNGDFYVSEEEDNMIRKITMQ